MFPTLGYLLRYLTGWDLRLPVPTFGLLWAAHYPHNVLRQGIFIPGCTGGYCAMLPDAVFPTSLWECAVCFALFFVLCGLRRRRLYFNNISKKSLVLVFNYVQIDPQRKSSLNKSRLLFLVCPV